MAETKSSTKKKKGISRLVKAETDLVSDVATAVGDGFKAFRDKVTSDNITRLDSDNGLVEGFFEGFAVVLEKEAKAFRSAFDQIKDD